LTHGSGISRMRKFLKFFLHGMRNRLNYVYYNLKEIYYRRLCLHVGKKLVMYGGTRIINPENLFIGDNVAINNDVWINAVGGVYIGNNVLIGPKVIIHSANHIYDDPNVLIRNQGHETKRVIIKDDVWICAGAIILPGVTIGQGAVVAAGAVVTKDVKPYSVVAGVPARTIKNRGEKLWETERLEEIQR